MYRDYKKKINKKIISDGLSAYFGNNKFSFEKLEGGFENASFLIKTDNKKYVLRIYNAVQFGRHVRDEKNILCELEFVEFLLKKGLPVPSIHKTKDGLNFTKVQIDKTNHFVILTDYIDGEQVNRLSLNKIKAVARVQAKIHIASMKYKPRILRKRPDPLDVQKWIKRELKDYKPPAKKRFWVLKSMEFFNYFDKKINKKTISGLSMIMIHGDLHLANLKFVGDEVSGVFDFDDVKQSIVADDIGSFLMDVFKTGDESELRKKSKTYFDEYVKINPISKREISQAILIAARRRLIFKTLKFTGLWENEKSDNLEDFKKVLTQTQKILDLVNY